jgi:2-polyprenyl-6-methoxyphenol hydroxylase-like FAD-dependent oxidoreductase
MVDVLIIGAGPTGLTLAIELLRRGLNIRIIDQLTARTTQSRALGLQARSLEVFEKLSVLDKMLDRGLPIDTVHLYQNGKQIGMTSLSILPIAYPFVLIIPQADTEAILTERLEELGGKIERGISFLELCNNQAVLAHPSEKKEIVAAKWIVGCDGAHSALRHALNIPFKGTKFSESFALADVTIPNCPLAHRDIHGFLCSTGILGCIPLPKKNQFRLITTSTDLIKSEDLTAPFLEKLIQNCTKLNLKIENILWASVFTIHRRIVPQMSKGSLFLCGDAAHIHSPAGGQGLNIGIQDAFNLAWKLALVHQGHAKEELLETYQEERHPIARHTLWGTTFATFFIAAPHSCVRRFFFKVLSLLFKLPSFRKRFAEALAEVRTHYKGSRLSWQPFSVIFWKGPKPGVRAPLLENAEETKFILLVFGAPDYKPDLPHDLFSIQHLPLDSVLATAYRAKKPCLYLIRPDGYIAFRSQDLSSNLRKEFEEHLLWIK